MTGDDLVLVDEHLRAIAGGVARMAAGRWRIRLRRACVVEVRMSDGWLVLSEPAGATARPGASLRMLRRNHEAGGPAAYVLCTDGRVRACYSLPLSQGVDIPRRIDEGMAGLDDVRRSATVPRAVGVDDCLLRAIAASGWLVRDGADVPEIDLGDPAPRGASVETYDDGSIRFALRLSDRMPAADAPREAVARLVLSCGTSIRGVHGEAAGCREEGCVAAARVVVSFASPPSPREIDHAAAALSLARDRYTPAVHALFDPDVARAYLTIGGASTCSTPFSKPRSRSAANTPTRQEAQP